MPLTVVGETAVQPQDRRCRPREGRSADPCRTAGGPCRREAERNRPGGHTLRDPISYNTQDRWTLRNRKQTAGHKGGGGGRGVASGVWKRFSPRWGWRHQPVNHIL